MMSIKKLVYICAGLIIFCYIQPSNLIAQTIEQLPFSKVVGQVQVTVHGVFCVDKWTKEGYIADSESQYKLLITYKNISNRKYSYSHGDEIPGVGCVELEVESGNVFSPKYVGGAVLAFDLNPNADYTTHNYAFNIPANEKPLYLYMKDNRSDEQAKHKFAIVKYIDPPIPRGHVYIEMNEELHAGNFVFIPIRLYHTERIAIGPYKGETYRIYESNNDGCFYILELRVINDGVRSESLPLYLHNGEFEAKLGSGKISPDVKQMLFMIDDQLAGNTTDIPSEIPLLGYPWLPMFPGTEDFMRIGFLVPLNCTIKEICFRLLAGC